MEPGSAKHVPRPGHCWSLQPAPAHFWMRQKTSSCISFLLGFPSAARSEQPLPFLAVLSQSPQHPGKITSWCKALAFLASHPGAEHVGCPQEPPPAAPLVGMAGDPAPARPLAKRPTLLRRWELPPGRDSPAGAKLLRNTAQARGRSQTQRTSEGEARLFSSTAIAKPRRRTWNE